jgi:hypothetical protein
VDINGLSGLKCREEHDFAQESIRRLSEHAFILFISLYRRNNTQREIFLVIVESKTC